MNQGQEKKLISIKGGGCGEHLNSTRLWVHFTTISKQKSVGWVIWRL